MYQRQSDQRQTQQQTHQQQSLKAIDLPAYDTKIKVSGTIQFADNYQIDIDNDGNVDTIIPENLRSIDNILDIINDSITTINSDKILTGYYNSLLNGLYKLITKCSPYFKYFNEWYYRKQWYTQINSLESSLKLIDNTYPSQLQLTVLPSVKIIKCDDKGILDQINSTSGRNSTYQMVFFDSNNILSEGIYVFDEGRMALTDDEQLYLKDRGEQFDQLNPPTYHAGYFIKTRVVQNNDQGDNVEKWRQGYVFYNDLLGDYTKKYMTFDIFEYSLNEDGKTIDKSTVQLIQKENHTSDIDIKGEPEYPSSKDIYANQPSPTWPIYSNERDDSKEVDDTTRIYCFMKDNTSNSTEKIVEYVFNLDGNKNTYPYTASHFQIYYAVCFGEVDGNYSITYSNIFYKKRAQVETYKNLVLKTEEQLNNKPEDDNQQ